MDLMLSRLDGMAEPKGSTRRDHRRFTYRVRSCRVKLAQPGSATATTYLVQTRNISAGGMSFLHGAFVHTGSRIVAQLITQHGAWNDVAGEVVFCRYVEKGMHEVGVQFDSEIRPSDYCANAMTYSFLIAEDDDAIARLAEHHLKQMNLDVDRAENGEVAVEMAQDSEYDCILMDLEMPILDGLEATRRIRQNGYAGAIVAMTARTRPEDRQAALEAGCDEFMSKPANRDTYERIIEILRREPVQSTLEDDPDMLPMLADFAKTIPAAVRQIEEAFQDGDDEAVERGARDMKGSAGSYGYDTICVLAEKLEKTFQDDDSDREDQRKLLTDLISLCMQVRPPRGASDAEAA